ncbi:OLC1v1030400C1 [Oldenlandia corymbosa var. corymbosa]|uniref:OLC1v1030400C1 n=1 Tax=Oldenlandia corymbosa var. corymbosa TaxID=529605 RepID=A0AAV1CJA6_OLDCO|nr:OLC1v1030400C1 [Oldenlandia corymbosa var. corymbosa]
MRVLVCFCPSLMLLLVPCCFVNVLLVSGQCLSDQKTLLLQLRDSLNVLPYSLSTKLVGWDKDTDCCFWAGVTCDSFGHVIGLDLSKESITGGIDEASSLFNLRFLQSLSLAENYFYSGQLPSNFGKLTSLRHLNLFASGFNGQIPGDFSKLTSLVSLDLSGNGIRFDNPNLEFLLRNLTSLRELYLDRIDFSAQGLEYLCRVLSSSQPDLQVLSLSGCNLSGPIDYSLAKLKSLSVIRLDYNHFSGPIPEFFADFPNLTDLSLSSCELSGETPEKIFQVPTLQTIDLSGNSELGGSLPEFPVESSLQNLLLSHTNFSGNLPDSIGNLRMLSTLDLSVCNFTGPVPRSVENLARLVNVVLFANHFSGAIPSFTSSRNLTTLNLRSNQFSGNISFFQFVALEKLVELDLSQNSIEGQIPGNLFSLPSLEKLILSYNNFSGSIAKVALKKSSSLKYIQLLSNELQGPVPQFLFHLENLTNLDLSWNQFNGTVDLIHFRSLPQLVSLDLSYNRLVVNTNSTFAESSSLPLFQELMLASCGIGNFPNLQNQYELKLLDLSSNQITGEIPSWLWDVGNGIFQYLNLSHNQLTHLQEPQKFVSLKTLDLTSNFLTGQLPADIGNYLPQLEYFSIANNRFSGTIPASLCNASSLRGINFSNNTLSKSIPSCLLNTSDHLFLLNLGRNNLTGNIPDILMSRCSLGALDLSFNHLGGQVPSSLSGCRSLEVLNLGGNRIDDDFPCWINNFTLLRVLVLRDNRFHGSITCPGNNYSWPKLQIVDLAENRFSGTLPAVLFSSLKAMTEEGDDPSVRLIQLQSEGKDILSIYQDSVTIVIKGGKCELNKVIITSIDLSSNHFQGYLPKTLGELRWVHLLNLSHNHFTGPIPPSVGNMKKLESSDLSFNLLSGKIPLQIAGLTFISIFNVSYNLLYGPIPKGPQIQTLSESNFLGNSALHGLPLSIPSNSHSPKESPVPPPEDKESAVFESDVYFSAAIGFLTSLLVMYWSLLCNKKWRKWYNNHLNRFVLGVL